MLVLDGRPQPSLHGPPTGCCLSALNRWLPKRATERKRKRESGGGGEGWTQWGEWQVEAKLSFS